MGERSSLTAFFPAYNDQHTIEGIVRTVAQEMRKVTDDFEVLVVDDGSKDQTGAILDRLAAELPFLRVIHHEYNLGYGAALITGFKNAKKDLIFYTDGDGQYDPGELPLLLKLAGRATGLVNGYKLERHDSVHRIWIGNVYNFCARFLFRIRIRDIDCDYRLIRRALLDQIHLTSTSGTICVELVRKLEMSGCDVAEVGVHHYPRLHGSSQFFRLRSLAHTLFELLRLWVRVVVLR